jgi:hypothetical protein
MGGEGGSSAHARGRGRRLAPGVAAAHHDHIEIPVAHGGDT